MVRAAQRVVETLKAAGVDTIFGVSGGYLAALLCEAERAGLRGVVNHHESAAVFMASGYAQATGKIGVVLVQSGPGATNALTGMSAAMMDQVPILLLAAQCSTQDYVT